MKYTEREKAEFFIGKCGVVLTIRENNVCVVL